MLCSVKQLQELSKVCVDGDETGAGKNGGCGPGRGGGGVEGRLCFCIVLKTYMHGSNEQQHLL